MPAIGETWEMKPPIEINFNWTDTEPVTIRNESGRPMRFAYAELIQGTTAGSATAGVYALTLPTTVYTFTTPATFPVGGSVRHSALGAEDIPPEGVIIGAVVTASGSAKDGKLRIYYWGIK